MPPRRPKRVGRRDFGTVQSIGTSTDPCFSVRWWEGGRQRRKRGFATRTEAHAFLARIQTAMGDGLMDLHRKGQVTLNVVGEEWLKAHSAVKLRSHRKNVERWGKLVTFFGQSLAIGEVTPSRIMQLREDMSVKRGLKPATVNRHLALLRTVLNHAVAAGYLQTSPVQRFPRGGYLMMEGGAKMKPPLAGPAEAAALLGSIEKVAPEWLAATAFLLYTGCRRGELAGVRYEDLDIGRRIVTIRRSLLGGPQVG